MSTRMKQSGEIRQNDTLHGLLVKLSGGFCFHTAAGHEKKMTHSQLWLDPPQHESLQALIFLLGNWFYFQVGTVFYSKAMLECTYWPLQDEPQHSETVHAEKANLNFRTMKLNKKCRRRNVKRLNEHNEFMATRKGHKNTCHTLSIHQTWKMIVTFHLLLRGFSHGGACS